MSPLSPRLVVLAVVASASSCSGFVSMERMHRLSVALKDSGRAHIERNLEEAMDNDWRVFRAKLVAQEKLEESLRRPTSSTATHHYGTTRRHQTVSNDLQRSTFQRGWANQSRHPTEQFHVTGGSSGMFRRRQSVPQPSPQTNIFAGNLVGGAHAITKPKMGRSSSSGNPAGIFCEDPFVTKAELPSLLPVNTPKLDKHRWAHEMPCIEPGAVLLASERLGGVFHQTVVLITEHSEATGTYGVVINRPFEGNLMKISNRDAAQKSSNVDLSLKMAFRKSRVAYGGPVWPEEYSVLHSFGKVAGARKLCGGVYVGGSQELMNQVRAGSMDPRCALFIKGHAAWEPKQLNLEIQKGVWYLTSVSSDFILRYAGAKASSDNPLQQDLWADILTCMGGNFADIARRHGGTGDARRLMP